MPIKVVQQNASSPLQSLMRIASLGAGAATGNPYLLANGLLGDGVGSSIQELVNTYDEWQKRKDLMDTMGSDYSRYGYGMRGYAPSAPYELYNMLPRR